MNPFQSVAGKRPLASKFDLSHNRKFSLTPGKLVPILCAEALPSDVWNYDCNALMRMAPMISPIMHMVDVCVHSFFYPERLTQRRGYFETFITGGKNGDGKNALGETVEAPYFMISNDPTSALNINVNDAFPPGSLGDFLGLQYPVGNYLGTVQQRINARPFIAFWQIYNEYFRDQNLDPDWVGLYPDIFDSPGGNITAAIFAALTSADPDSPAMTFFFVPTVCWEKDYFTSALPFAQRGEAVEVPLSGSATVTYMPTSEVYESGGGVPNGDLFTNNGAPNILFTTDDGSAGSRVENIDELNLNAGGFTITALRTAARLQEWLEKMATGGARYIEQIKAQFGVTSSDARLQRPEYLGGGKIPMHINEVVQNSADDSTPLAEMAGHGVTAGQVTNFRKFVEEHGYFMVFIYLRPKTAYQTGLPRMLTNRFDKLDYAWPSFANIGEQEILRKEIYYDGSADDEDIFGYQQRYAEYKYIPSTVHGEFRTDLNHWHWGRDIQSPPTLDSQFVHCDPDPRIFNLLVEGTEYLYCIVNNRITAKRPLPYYGTPTL